MIAINRIFGSDTIMAAIQSGKVWKIHMMEAIIRAIRQEVELTEDECRECALLLAATLAAAGEVNLIISEERLLLLGVHLVAVLRRARSGEMLPAVDESMLQQVAKDMQDLARKILGVSLVTRICQKDSTEVLLLAVHLAAAREEA